MENENKDENKQGEKNDSLSIVDEARKLRDEIRAENDRREEILKQEQKLQAEKLLGSSAGSTPQEKTLTEKEIKTKEAVDFWKGTGIDEAIKKYEN